MSKFSHMSDEEIALFMQENNDSEEALNALIERHSGICVDMINSFLSKNYNNSLREELIKEKDYLIYSSALKYKTSKGAKFSTFLANCIKWKCLNIFNKDKRRQAVPVDDDKIEYLSYSNKSSTSHQDIDIYSNIINQSQKHPDKRIRRIFYLRYEKGNNNSVMPWRMISGELDMSIQGCINLHNSAIQQFKNKIIKEI